MTRLGLVEKVSLNDTDLVNYSYLAVGTKVSDILFFVNLLCIFQPLESVEEVLTPLQYR